MPQIAGRGNIELLLEDDGTLWSKDKSVQYDPDTWEPMPSDRPKYEFRRASPKPEKPFKCDKCNASFDDIGKLKRHYWRMHKKVYQEG